MLLTHSSFSDGQLSVSLIFTFAYLLIKVYTYELTFNPLMMLSVTICLDHSFNVIFNLKDSTLLNILASDIIT